MKITDRMQEIIDVAELHYRRVGVMPLCSEVAERVGTSRQYAHDTYRAAVESGRWVRRGRSWETCAIVGETGIHLEAVRKTTDTPIGETGVPAGETT